MVSLGELQMSCVEMRETARRTIVTAHSTDQGFMEESDGSLISVKNTRAAWIMQKKHLMDQSEKVYMV